MRVKKYSIQIWFFDEDLHISASQHSNKMLIRSIHGCYQALISAYMYQFGIRSEKFFRYYFDKSRRFETMNKIFPNWPLKNTPTFENYTSRTSKWCRKCREHFDYVKYYLECLLLEYEYRYNRLHNMTKFIEWLNLDVPNLKLPTANLKKITVEWKVLNPRYRRKNILEGYKLQAKYQLINNGGIQLTDFTNRDIPEWLFEKENQWLK